MKKHSTAKPIPCFKRWSRTNYAVFASLHRQVTIGVLAVGMSILLLTTETAAAQQADTSGVSRVMRIEPVGVTGTRLSPSRSIQSQTPVFDRGTEAAAPFQTLEDALRLSPSIDIRERSGKGVQADISIRGGSPDQTMMLLNGINFTDARTGHQTHSLPIDMDCVSGIELIEGIPGVPMPVQSTAGPFLCIATIFGSKPKAGNTGMAIPICPELLHATVSCSSPPDRCVAATDISTIPTSAT